MKKKHDSHHISRRDFIKFGVAGTAAASLGLAGMESLLHAQSTAPLAYRMLGRTGLKVTTLSFGAMLTPEWEVIRAGLDRGINYVDTARRYLGGKSESIVGRALKGIRDKVYVATKTRPDSNTGADIIKDVETSLTQLQTDHIDVVQLHSLTSRERAFIPEVREAYVKLRKQGKVRFFGVTTHSNQAEVVNAIVDDPDKFFDTVLVGYNFTFGARARGNAGDLRRFGERLGFRVIVIDPVVVNGSPASSTAIRGALARGDVESARAMLGRPYSLRGVVVHGDGRGRGLGIPTANISVPPVRLVPAAGVYATVAAWRGLSAASVTNVGWKPTFRATGGGEPSIETHILGFDGDLYGATLELHFLAKLREERRFDDQAALVEQVGADVKRALDICSAERAKGGRLL